MRLSYCDPIKQTVESIFDSNPNRYVLSLIVAIFNKQTAPFPTKHVQPNTAAKPFTTTWRAYDDQTSRVRYRRDSTRIAQPSGRCRSCSKRYRIGLLHGKWVTNRERCEIESERVDRGIPDAAVGIEG